MLHKLFISIRALKWCSFVRACVWCERLLWCPHNEKVSPSVLPNSTPNQILGFGFCWICKQTWWCVVSLLICSLPSLRVSQPIDPRALRSAAEGTQSHDLSLQHRDAEPKHHPRVRHLSNAHDHLSVVCFSVVSVALSLLFQALSISDCLSSLSISVSVSEWGTIIVQEGQWLRGFTVWGTQFCEVKY